MNENAFQRFDNLARKIAGYMKRHMSQIRLDFEDMYQAAWLGIMKAVRTNPHSDEGYAQLFIYSEIKEHACKAKGLKSWDVYKKAGKLRTAIARLKMRLQRSPTREEILSELRCTEDQLKTMEAADRFDTAAGRAHDDTYEIGKAENPTDSLERQELQRHIELILTPKRAEIINLHYFEHKTFAQISQQTGASAKSIASEATKARRTLATKMAPYQLA